jgi:hypothetical protein
MAGRILAPIAPMRLSGWGGRLYAEMRRNQILRGVAKLQARSGSGSGVIAWRASQSDINLAPPFATGESFRLKVIGRCFGIDVTMMGFLHESLGLSDSAIEQASS